MKPFVPQFGRKFEVDAKSANMGAGKVEGGAAAVERGEETVARFRELAVKEALGQITVADYAEGQ